MLLDLADLGDFDPATTNGHRECLPNKSCPGAAINMDTVRAELHAMASTSGRYVSVLPTVGVNVRQGPGVSFPVAAKLPYQYVFFSDGTTEGEAVGGDHQWVHMYGPDRATVNPLGFVHASLVQEVTP